MSIEELAAVFAQMAEDARADSRQAMEAFAHSYTAALGGQLTIVAPSRPAKRSFPEAGYRSEQYQHLNT